MVAIEKLFEEARALPPRERGELIRRLEETLDDEGEPLTPEEADLADREMAAELDRRMREVDEGRMELVSWEDVKASLRARYPGL